MSLKGAIFDLDGTLLDTEPIYFKATEEMIKEYGNGKEFGWDTKIKTLGSPEIVTAKIVVDTFEMKLTPEEFLNKRNAITPEYFKNCLFIEGAKEITDKFKKELKFKTALATSSSKYNFDFKTFNKKEWLKEDFDKIILGDDPRIKKGKPSPDIFILAANEIGLSPNECIMFEDSIGGIKACISSGAKIVVGIPDPHLKDKVKDIKYDENITKLIILDKLKDFDFSLINQC
jgi:pseudouridine-5'-monophosphatase